jgi:DNA-binding winged helix-turn-helix (wHTH) protein/Tol biopolymer transport system component
VEPNQPAGKHPLLHFEGFDLDAERRGLYKDGQRIHLTPKPMETLIFLVLNQGRVVGKQELLDSVWKDTFVGEDTLVQAVREIRLALRDDRKDPHFIQTVPREGYRFIAEVVSCSHGVDALHDTPQVGTMEPETLATAGSSHAGPSQEPRKSRWIVPVFLVASGGVVLVLFYLGRRPDAPSLVNPPILHQLTSSLAGAMKPSFSSEGNLLYVESGVIHIRPAGTDSSFEITDKIFPSGDLPTFTANGDRVVFSRPRTDQAGTRTYDLFQVESIGGPVRPFLTDAVGAGFSPDGHWVAYTEVLACDRPLWISRTDSSERILQVSDRGFTPRWSPDGKWLAFTTSDPNEGLGSLWITSFRSAAGGQLAIQEKKQLTFEREQFYGLTWTSDSRSVIFAARRQGRMDLYRVGVAGGLATALTTGAGEYSSPCVSPDGRTLVFSHLSSVADLMIAPTTGCPKVTRLTEDEYHRWPRLSPSGERLVSVSRRPDYDERVYVFDLRTMMHHRISERTARYPMWLDEDTVAYLVDTPEGKTRVCATSVVGGITVILADFNGEANWLAVHPNQRELAVVMGAPGCKQRILIRNLDRPGQDRILAQGNEYEQLRWLPDGSGLSWSGPSRASPQGGYGVWVMKRGDRNPTRLVKDGYGPVWSEAGDTVYFSRIGTGAGLWKFDLLRKKETQICSWEMFHFKEYDVARDRLVFTEHDARTQIYSMTLDVN